MQVLVEDPDLGEDLDEERLAAATAVAGASMIVVRRGDLDEVQWSEDVRHGDGLLVLEGLLARCVEVEGRSAAELLGRGDLLRPWQREEAIVSPREHAGWRVLSRSRVAILDVGFIQRIAAYPEIQGRLVERSTARARHLAFALAIVNQPLVETRLRMMLWHLAERWGRVRPDGVLIPKVTHEVLGELIAARRPTVSSALAEMERRGEVARTREGWLLRERRASTQRPT